MSLVDSRSPIYLDHAATTPMAPEIARHMAELISRWWANPASQHAAGRQALATLEDAKDRIKAICLGSSAQNDLQTWQLITTSGGTEANNLAVHGLADTPETTTPTTSSPPILIGATEHPSVLTTAQTSPTIAPRCQIVPVDPKTGQVNIDALESSLAAWTNGLPKSALVSPRLASPRPASNPPASHRPRPLVSIMLGNNETGIVTDIQAVSAVCRRYGAILHTDAVQALGKLPASDFVPFVDAFTISAHKLLGPVGVGALMVRSSVKLRPMLFGGGQQLELRPGSESVVLVSALAEACQAAENFRADSGFAQLTEYRLTFEKQLTNRVPLARIVGQNQLRLPHISSISFPGFDRQALLMALDLAGVQCSSGSACASGSSQPSHVLVAMGLPPEWVAGTIRFSFGRSTTLAEIEAAVDRIERVILGQSKASPTRLSVFG
ncbi:MAG: cysteine desulfurase [Pirellulaceae bacterium]|nr:cysteine desulfurase [Pirellulaceae bacterium]